jgi:hypothetical protein
MTQDDWLFWGLFAITAAIWLTDHWRIRMLKAHIQALENGGLSV